MTQQRGSTAQIIVGFETTYATAASTGYQLPFNSCGVVGTKTRNTPDTLTGTRNPAEPFAGNYDAGGPVVVPVDSAGLPYWLHAMFDDCTTTGSDPYVHEYKISDSMPSFTLEKGFTDLASSVYERIVGCRVSTFALTIGGDGELTCSIDVLGAKQTEETSSFDGSATSVTLARLNNFDAAITEGGSTITNAKEIAVNLDFGLDTDEFVIGGGGVRGNLPEGIVSVTGNLKTLFESKTLLDKAINDTESSLKVTVTGSASSVFELEFQELLYSVNGVPVEGPQGLVVSLDFVGYYSNGSEASAAVARVTNGTSSYSL